jgi:hypothetical protein
MSLHGLATIGQTFSGTYAEAVCRPRMTLGRQRYLLQLKADLTKPLVVVLATDPDVIDLPENLKPIEGQDHAGILHRGSWPDRHRQERNPARSQNPVNLGHGPSIVNDVLENMTGQNQVETGIVKTHRREVGTNGRRIGEIDIDVDEAPDGLQSSFQAILRRDMKHPRHLRTKVDRS